MNILYPEANKDTVVLSIERNQLCISSLSLDCKN